VRGAANSLERERATTITVHEIEMTEERRKISKEKNQGEGYRGYNLGPTFKRAEKSLGVPKKTRGGDKRN